MSHETDVDEDEQDQIYSEYQSFSQISSPERHYLTYDANEKEDVNGVRRSLSPLSYHCSITFNGNAKTLKQQSEERSPPLIMSDGMFSMRSCIDLRDVERPHIHDALKSNSSSGFLGDESIQTLKKLNYIQRDIYLPPQEAEGSTHYRKTTENTSLPKRVTKPHSYLNDFDQTATITISCYGDIVAIEDTTPENQEAIRSTESLNSVKDLEDEQGKIETFERPLIACLSPLTEDDESGDGGLREPRAVSVNDILNHIDLKNLASLAEARAAIPKSSYAAVKAF